MKDTVLRAIELVLQRAFPDFSVEDYSVKSGSSHGDNYVGIMYAIQAALRHNKTKTLIHKNLILKTSPENQVRKDFEETLQLFTKEASVYTKLIPELRKFQENVITDSKNYADLAFVPCYDVFTYSENPDERNNFPWQYILMEDMREQGEGNEDGGYKMACRITGLDYKHCELVMAALAKYHAVSYAYMQRTLQRSEEIFERFPFLKESMFNKENESRIKEIYTSGSEPCKRFFSKYFPETTREYQILKQLVDGVFNINTHFIAGSNDLPFKLMAETPADINDVNFTDRERKIRNQWLVLSHGDCWVNNFLFKYAGNVPVAVKLVDLQIVREVCLTTDLTYFLYMSSTGDLRKHYLDKLLKVYYENFMSTCENLEVRPWKDFTLESLRNRIRNNLVYGASTASSFLALIILPKESTMNMEEEAKDGNFFGSIFEKAASLENDNLKHRLLSIVNECIEAKVID